MAARKPRRIRERAMGKPIELRFVGFDANPQPPRFGPSGMGCISVEAAHNGLIVRRPYFGDRPTLVSPDEVAVFTDADAFGRWMTEHFRMHLRNVATQNGENTCAPR